MKRAITAGGPYLNVAAPNSDTHTDAGPTNGTTYYYVVSAVSSAGESGNSAEVSACPALMVTVDFDLNFAGATDAPPSQNVAQGSLVTRPADPARANYLFTAGIVRRVAPAPGFSLQMRSPPI